jgi:hypothetical protein
MPIDIVPFVLANAVFVSWACAIVLVGFTRWGGERRRLVIAITCAITLFCGGLYYYRYERIELRYGKAATAGDPEASTDSRSAYTTMEAVRVWIGRELSR